MDSETPELVKDVQMLHELAVRNRTAQMRTLLERLVPQYPDDHDVLYYAAQVEWLEDKDEDALEAVNRLLERYPESYSGRMLHFRILDGLERRGEAEAVILELLRDYPESAELYGRYSVLMLESMNIDKAGKLAAHAVSLDPDDERALTASVLHQLLVDPGEPANHRLQELVSRYPDAVNTMFMAVAVLSRQNRDKEALLIAQELLRQRPDSQPLVEMVVGLKTVTHWTMLPLRPIQKWGWAGSIGIWFVVVLLLQGLDGTALGSYASPLALIFIAYVIYSWTWPHLLKRWIRR